MGHCASIVVVVLVAACNVPGVTFTPLVDDAAPTPDGAAMMDSAVDAAPGTAGAPGMSCSQLREVLGPVSGVYWVLDDPHQPAFQVYCEQIIEGGGWAVVYNSVLRLDGTTTAFWNILHPNRFDTKGAPSVSDNYYAGSMYRRGTSFLDVITDLAGTDAVALRADSQGIEPEDMKFKSPVLVSGSAGVFVHQFSGGWAAPGHDRDLYDPYNCAEYYNNVTQHYNSCWNYNLGSDADVGTLLDGGVGPHVNNTILTQLGLSPQPGGGQYSRVQRITRYVRW